MLTQEKANATFNRGYAKAIVDLKEPTVAADYGKLELYSHDCHYLLCRFLVVQGIALCDVECEIYPTYVVVADRVIPYDLINTGTEQETLLVWI